MKRAGKPLYFKNCEFCDKPFMRTTTSRRKQTCNKVCGMKLAGLHNKIKISKEEILNAINKTSTFRECCDELKIGAWTLMRRMKNYDIKRPKTYKKRNDGYWHYKSKLNHRRKMEKHLRRKLQAHEQVHHIDGDKDNNNPRTNLIIVNGPGEHGLVHQSLQEIGYALYKKGIIKFDHKTKRYYLFLSGDTI